MIRLYCNRSYGNSLVQYAIVLGLLAVALVPAFFMIGGTITQNFSDFYHTLAGNAPSGSLGGQAGSSAIDLQNVEVNCQGNDCSLKLTESVSLNISDDLAEIIETSGAAGGTEHLASVLTQIADQADQLNLSQKDQQLLYQLSRQAEKIASYEKQTEYYSKQMSSVISGCLSHYNHSDFSKMSKLKRYDYLRNLFMPLKMTLESNDALKTYYENLHHIGGDKPSNSFEYGGGKYDSGISTADSTMQQFKNTRDQLESSLSDPNVANIVNLLAGDVEMLADNMFDSFQTSPGIDLLEDIDRLYQVDNVFDELLWVTYFNNSSRMNRELSNLQGVFDGVANANDGLTSEQTDLDSKLMKAAAEAKKEEDKTDKQDDKQDEDKEPDKGQEGEHGEGQGNKDPGE